MAALVVWTCLTPDVGSVPHSQVFAGLSRQLQPLELPQEPNVP